MEPRLQEMQAEIERLKVEIESTPRDTSISATAAIKDVTLVAGIKDWTGDSKGRTVHEFFAQIDTYAKVSNWSDEEKALIAKAKLQGIALQFVQGREFLTSDVCPYADLKQQLITRFSEKMPAQYHYTRLQDATQDRGESVEEFADRCRKLCQKTVRHVEDAATQRIINEEAERRLVAAYINGLTGVVGQQVRFRMPHTLDEAVQVAVTVSNAERLRAPDTKRVFSTKRDNPPQGTSCFNCGKKGHFAKECRSPRKNETFSGDRRARDSVRGRGRGAAEPSQRNSTMRNPNGRQIRCFHCKKLGHRRDQCPQLARSNSTTALPNNQGSTSGSPKSTLGQQASQ
jgi:hypothetical protein